MSTVKRLEWELTHDFDRARCRHFLNGQFSVLHCHHYTVLYTRLALDAEFLDGKTLLAQCAEDSFHHVFTDYFAGHPHLTRANKLTLGCQHYAALGLGQMATTYVSQDCGEVRLMHSHVDEGWIAKWGQSDKPVNYITNGFITALFAVTYDLPARSFHAHELESIVMGAAQSRFSVVRA